jgi:sialic acid synthase SpsE
MVMGIRNVERALGSSAKRPSGAEIPNRVISRRSIVAGMDMPRGVTITSDMLAIKRPGTGISPKHFEALVGRRVVAAIKKDELITWDKVR